MPANISSIARLRQLPAVFSIADLEVDFGFAKAKASTYLSRWSAGGLVSRYGGGVYFNLIEDRDGPSRREHEALAKLLRRPFLLVGASALGLAGWTTQEHRIKEVAVPVRRGRISLPQVAGGTLLVPRYMSWFGALQSSLPAGAAEVEGIPVAAPEFALADALLSQDLVEARNRRVHLPPPDEIDPDVFDEEAAERLVQAMIALGAEEGAAREKAADYLEVAGRPGVCISY